MSQFFVDYKANPYSKEPFTVHTRMKSIGCLKAKWSYVQSFETLLGARRQYPAAVASQKAERMQHELEFKTHRFDGPSYDTRCRVCGKDRDWQAHLGGGA